MKTKEQLAEQVKNLVFKFNVTDIVKPLPFYDKGVLITPRPEERYRIVARAWTEGINLQSMKIKKQVIYHCLPLHVLTKNAKNDPNRVRIVPQEDDMGKPFLKRITDD